jgi:hypothetical protein
MIGFSSNSATSSLNYHQYSAIADLHTFQSTVAHALGSSVSTSRLLAMDLNTETSISDHYEVFLLFRLQSLWNLGTKNSSGLSPPADDWLVTASELTLSLQSLLLKALCTDPTENTVFIVDDVTAYAEVCLPSRCLETGCITPLFRRCSAWTTYKTQPHLLLRVGPCLQSCCLATRWSNVLQYFKNGFSSIFPNESALLKIYEIYP